MNGPRPSLQQFAGVDATSAPTAFAAYLDAVHASEFAAYKRLTFELQEPNPDHVLLDVGCGTGEDARALADLVDARLIVGVDASEALIAEARTRTPTGMPVEFVTGDAHALDFPADTFDGCRADRVFQHLADAERALGELVRVCRSGGRIVVADSDWDTLVVDSPDKRLTRALVRAISDACENGWSGRRLPAMFARSGLEDVEVIPVTAGITDFAVAEVLLGLATAVEQAAEAGTFNADEGTAWLDELRRASARGEFFAALTGFVTCGRKT